MKILMTTTNEKENKLSEIDPRPREKRFTMRSVTREILKVQLRLLSTWRLYS